MRNLRHCSIVTVAWAVASRTANIATIRSNGVGCYAEPAGLLHIGDEQSLVTTRR